MTMGARKTTAIRWTPKTGKTLVLGPDGTPLNKE